MSTKLILSAAAGIGLFAGSLAEPASAQTLTTELVVSVSNPVLVVSPPSDFDRLFIVSRGGIIRIVKNGALLPTPFIDVSSIITAGGEQGLLGLAFHPDYASNGRFFINYTDNSGGDTVVAEYAVSANPDVANATQVQQVFTMNQPFSNHNGGMIAFGPDGKLYIGMGDGGAGNDPGNRSQNPMNNLGKMIRLDVDIASPFIPADNPFVGVAGFNEEIWALGVRNPWRFSFDMGTGDMYIADVGQNAVEEIDFQPASSTGGENYGWRCMEGNNCTGLSGCTCNDIALTDPIQTYTHSGGNCSITGGYVYRSNEIPSLQGTYFYADFCSNRIWSFRVVGGAVTEFTNRTTELDPPNGTISSISSFGQDAAGNVYICELGGQIWKITQECGVQNYCQATDNSSGNPATMSSVGVPSIGTNNFDLVAASAVPNGFGLFYYGGGQVQTLFGDGFRCVGAGGQGTFRLQPPLQADGFGDVQRQLDFTAPPANAGGGQINVGSTWNFQYWFRDPMGPGGTGFNLSDGLSVLFCP